MLLVELLGWVFGHIEQRLGWLEWSTVQIGVRLHLADQLVGAVVVDPAEWATGEWWKAETKHGSDVTLQRVVEDLFLQTEDGFVDESENKIMRHSYEVGGIVFLCIYRETIRNCMSSTEFAPLETSEYFCLIICNAACNAYEMY